MKIQTVCVVLLALCVVVASRFVAIAGLNVELYGKVVAAFFYSIPRIFIFLCQFTGVAFLAKSIRWKKPLDVGVYYPASLSLMLVSVARFYMPLFIVSVAGDLLVIWWLRNSTSVRHQER